MSALRTNNFSSSPIFRTTSTKPLLYCCSAYCFILAFLVCYNNTTIFTIFLLYFLHFVGLWLKVVIIKDGIVIKLIPINFFLPDCLFVSVVEPDRTVGMFLGSNVTLSLTVFFDPQATERFRDRISQKTCMQYWKLQPNRQSYATWWGRLSMLLPADYKRERRFRLLPNYIGYYYYYWTDSLSARVVSAVVTVRFQSVLANSSMPVDSQRNQQHEYNDEQQSRQDYHNQQQIVVWNILVCSHTHKQTFHHRLRWHIGYRSITTIAR